jgi:phosphotransferase system enzyme I (PtsI)
MEPERFRIQLRALLRASKYGKINILIPMLASAREIDQTLVLITQAKASLDAEGTPYDREVKIGGMIEVPAAALALGVFTRKLDFLSIGTNDLIQYTLAIDRTDDAVAHLYDPLHPAVLSLIAHVLKTADKAGVPVALCGEMAGDLSLTRLLLGLGLRQYSMHSAHLLDVKQRVLQSSLAHVKPLALRMLREGDPDRLRMLLDRMNA